MRLRPIAVMGLAIVIGGCGTAPQPPDAAALRAAIAAQTQEYLGCFRDNGDSDCVASYFSDEGVQVLSNTPALIGPEAIRRHWQQALGWGQWEVTLTTQLVEPSLPLAVERGRYVMRFVAGPGAPPNRPSADDRGTYLVHWRHDPDGKWRIAAQVLASELPGRVVVAPAPGESIR